MKYLTRLVIKKNMVKNLDFSKIYEIICKCKRVKKQGKNNIVNIYGMCYMQTFIDTNLMY